MAAMGRRRDGVEERACVLLAADIAEVARDVGAGLIVVGGGRGPPLSLLRGGVSHDLLRLAPCPVVIQR